MTTGTAMIHFAFYGDFSVWRTIQTPKNIWHELDGVSRPFGYTRRSGEHIGDYARRFRQGMASTDRESIRGMQRNLALELGHSVAWLDICHTDTQTVPWVYVSDHTLVMKNITTTSTSSAIYSLLHGHENSLEELAGKITIQNDTYEASIKGHFQENRSLLPMDILDDQQNVSVKTILLPVATSFNLPHKPILPSSVYLEESMDYWTEKTSVATLSTDGDYHIDYLSGKFSSYSKAPSGAGISYLVAETAYSFQVMPGAFVNISNQDILNRTIQGTSTNQEVFRTSTASDGVATSTTLQPYFYLDPYVQADLNQGLVYENNVWGA